MFRYIGFLWDPQCGDSCESARRLISGSQESASDLGSSLTTPGMHVLTAGIEHGASRVHTLDGECGVVLGTLFTSPQHGESRSIRERELASDTAQLIRTRGQHLITNYWGRYVGFFADRDAEAHRILRDPSGGLPCFMALTDGVTVVFSSLGDFIRLRAAKLSINWSFIAARIALGTMQFSATALKEISELRPGDAMDLVKGRASHRTLWKPLENDFQPFDNPEPASVAIRDVTKECVSAWASLHTSILHEVSGGLDSSIVAACLASARTRPTVTCVKIFTPNTTNVERDRARAVARRAGFRLVEASLDAKSVRLERLLQANPCPTPNTDIGISNVIDVERELARDVGAHATFNGQMGDILFGNSTKEFAALDYIARHGLRPNAIKVALGTALITDRSIWYVLRNALRGAVLGSSWNLPALVLEHRKLATHLARELVLAAPELYEPRQNASRAVPFGTFNHFLLLSSSFGMRFYDPFLREQDGGVPEPVYPLTSQPLVELLLRVPTYLHNQGGRERWLARQAFWADLPPELLLQLWKDAAPGVAQGIVLENMDFVRDLLLNGIQVEQGLLDRDKLEDALVKKVTRRTSFSTEIFDHIATEAWLRNLKRCTEIA